MNVGFKPTLTASIILSLSLLLAACGGAAPESKQNVQGKETQNVESKSSSVETRLYTDGSNREVTIPVSPEKVVVLTYGGYLLPLGLKPEGADQKILELYPEEMAEVTNVGEGQGNLEAIAALQPDLIILPDFFGDETIASYEKIAPSVIVAWGGDPDVVKTLRSVGDIMNRKQEAEAWITKFEAKLQHIRDELSFQIKPGTTALTFIIYNGEVLIGGESGTLGELIYKDFGFQMPKQYKSMANGGGVISLESLADKPADYFFTQMLDDELDSMNEMFKSPVYQTLPPIKNKHIFNTSRDKWNYGPFLIDEVVDELIEQVSKL